MSSRKCRGCSRAVTCRTAATAKLLQPLVPAAWPRTKLRNFLRTKGYDGGFEWAPTEVSPTGGPGGTGKSHKGNPIKCGTVPLFTSVPPVVKLLIFYFV